MPAVACDQRLHLRGRRAELKTGIPVAAAELASDDVTALGATGWPGCAGCCRANAARRLVLGASGGRRRDRDT